MVIRVPGLKDKMDATVLAIRKVVEDDPSLVFAVVLVKTEMIDGKRRMAEGVEIRLGSNVGQENGERLLMTVAKNIVANRDLGIDPETTAVQRPN